MRARSLLSELFPLSRSLTGDGVRETLRILKREMPELEIHETPSGTKCFDWIVPDEWRFTSARLFDESGSLIIDADDCPLHCVGYSAPFNGWVSLEELVEHLVVGPEEYPDAIEYSTSYYEREWGLSVSWNQFRRMQPGKYFVAIDTELFPGSLTHADLVFAGETDEEVMLSSYVCHPQLAVNELSGPVVLSAVVKWWKSSNRRHTLRVLLAPETLGPLVFLANSRTNAPGYTMRRRLNMKLRAGFTLTCMGGSGNFYVQEGRSPNYASAIASYVLRPPTAEDSLFGVSPWKHRCSDERQWTSPGIDLPFCTLMKSRPGSPEYDEYHTSRDNLDACTEEQLEASVEVVKRILTAVERDRRYQVTTLGEPQLGRRGLYETLSKRGSSASGKALLDVWSMCDGRSSLAIAKYLEKPIDYVQDVLDLLKEHGLVEEVR